MNRCKMVKVTGLLKETRAVLTFLALKRKILRMILLDMIVHGVLLLSHLFTVRADKVPIGILNIL